VSFYKVFTNRSESWRCRHLQVRKRDGAVGYDSTDLAAIRYRLETLKHDWLIYVVDSGQSLHFDVSVCVRVSCHCMVHHSWP
jgi:arginyl-tRNA synthetase